MRAPPPDAYTFKQMIRNDATNSDYFDRMMIGRVQPYGTRAPREAMPSPCWPFEGIRPVGFPASGRVQFYTDAAVTSGRDNVNFRLDDRFVVIAHRLDDGSYRSGRLPSRERRFESLLFLARKYELTPSRLTSGMRSLPP